MTNSSQPSSQKRLIVISGQSGAGKSVALRVLEDLGYYCVDNLPVSLLESFVQSIQGGQQNVAVSIDIRNLPQDPALVTTTLTKLKSELDVNVLFLDADETTLLKRYSETRRIHPLSMRPKEKLSLEQAIRLEKGLLLNLKEYADLVLDSSNQSLHDLSETVRQRVEGRESKELVMVFESFGFKYGLPNDADYVFDVRFLPNPHWEPALRPQTGLDAPIKAFLEKHDEVTELKNQIQCFIEHWLPLLQKNNRSYLTVAIGCTGGKHRSVYITQQLGEYFTKQGQQVQIRHTSLEKHHK
ncbi:putative P-loop-containing kinase [Vibrio nigripulchritudo MADA3029]|uniref:P-loop-containing kinase n=2 Tax=Vibrio nigripulchritudo TaxID=28173 RepID=A0AAV2VL85_9VIBR|nr:RNase adapter RapZ [Vibrio nigripulchritudo]EGU59686.1 glmZ(sRNA)-inactivating NTPase [Vibrio nigripulchritudo ATCC 27043]CCN37985.1 putative P-loop-containing kinase [Vibrio nigripulchritudo AM115]CCN39000.1 putative P-loop-containing kinase [Vibrio nigripulchritudo FTn2]CCN45086.1 putative P-loop-containing kinase [Vibrio nigripulchritudo MADA3020]CCN54424.1 putative P-loop-containing kinase [Vibrio nigripulchritudo MADA3021]